MSERVPAVKRDVVGAPHSWDKAVSYAYLRLIGQSQVEAAKGAGVGERTVVRWELSDWWPKALAEASDRWLNDVEAASRVTVLAAIKSGNATLAWEVLQRRDPKLSPKHIHEHSGPNGQPIPHRVEIAVVHVDAFRGLGSGDGE